MLLSAALEFEEETLNRPLQRLPVAWAPQYLPQACFLQEKPSFNPTLH